MMENLISYHWLKDNFEDENLILLDVSPKENKGGMIVRYPDRKIRGARLLDLAGDFSDPDSDLPNTMPSEDHFQRSARKLGIKKDSKIVVYDNLGIYTSPRVWYMFKAMGHENISVLDGGLDLWVENGGETEENSRSRNSFGNFEASFTPSYLITADEIAMNLNTDKLVIVDARSSQRFHCIVPEPRAGLARGRIPHSINLPFEDVLSNGCFKTANDLKYLYNSVNPDGKNMIFTCGSGLTASIILFAMNLVSETTMRLYDGSWTEWAQLDYEIER